MFYRFHSLFKIDVSVHADGVGCEDACPWGKDAEGDEAADEVLRIAYLGGEELEERLEVFAAPAGEEL